MGEVKQLDPAYQVAVVTPTHPARMDTLLPQAAQSLAYQEFMPAQHSVAIDVHRNGAPMTRHRALMAVDSDLTPWVAFLDSDDYFYPEHLRVLVNAAAEHEADYVYSWFDVIGGIDPFPVTHCTTVWDPDNPRHTTITTLVRTKLAQEIGFVKTREQLEGLPHGGEDWDFTLACIAAGAQIWHVPGVRTWGWRHHGGNTSGQPWKGDAA